MLANTRVWCRLILPLIIIASVWQDVEGSGRVQVHLVSYEDLTGRLIGERCCDEEDTRASCRPCDHYIVICLMDVREHNKGPCISNNITTEVLRRSSTIIFGSDIGNVTNPFSLYFTLPSNPNLLWKSQCIPVNVKHIEASISAIATGMLMFQYKLQCDEDFYSMCDQFCHSNDMAYRCDHQGHKICKLGNVCETPIKSEMTTIYPGIPGVAILNTKVKLKTDEGHISKYPQWSSSTAFLKPNMTTVYTTISHIKKTISEAYDSPFRPTSKQQSTGTPLSTRALHPPTIETSATPSLPSMDNVPAPRDKVPLYIGIILGSVLCIILLISSILYFVLHRRNRNKVKNDGVTDDNDVVHDENIIIGDKIPLKVQNALNV